MTGAMFNGADDYVDLEEGKPTDLTGDITISAWINPEGWGEGSSGSIIDNGKLRYILYATTTGVILTSNNNAWAYSADNSISTNTWKRILVTRPSAGTNTNFYIDGVLSGDANQNSGTPEGGTTNTFIGNREANDRTFDGKIANIKIWNRKIGAIEESRRMFQEGRKAA